MYNKYNMMKFMILGVIPFFSSVPVSAQAPDTTWTKRYGTQGPLEWFQSVEQLADSGYILCGSWDDDLLLMKTDACGDSLWTKLYGEAGVDCGFCAAHTEDGGYIITGLRATGSGDLWLLRTDAAGDTIWTKTYGGPQDDIGFWVEPAADGGFIICGQTESLGGIFGTWLLKTDSLGDTVWTHVYEGLVASPGHRFVQLADSGYMVTTNSLYANNYNPCVIKTDALGDTIWTHVYGGPDTEIASSFLRTDDGGYLLAGYITTAGNDNDGWLLKIDDLGNEQWTQVYAGAGHEEFRSVTKTSDSGYVLCGAKSPSPMSFIDIWFMKVDSNGDSVWARTWGGGQAAVASDVKSSFDGGYVLAGSAYLAGSYDDAWLLKTQPEVGVEENDQKVTCKLHMEISPNPFTSMTRIRYSILDSRFSSQELTMNIYDVTGRLVKSFHPASSIHNQQSVVSWDGRDDQNRMLGSGIYLLELRTNSSSLISKLIYIE